MDWSTSLYYCCKQCRLFGVQDKNTNTRCNPTLYTKGHGHQVKPSGAYWPYTGHGWEVPVGCHRYAHS